MPLTKGVNKALLPVYDRCLLQAVLDEAVSVGVERFIFIVTKGDRSIADYLRPHKALDAFVAKKKAQGHKEGETIGAFLDRLSFISKGSIIVEQDSPRGLGDAIFCAASHVADDDYYAVLLADDFIDTEGKTCLQQMCDGWHRRGQQGAWVALEQVAYEDVSRYGVIRPVCGEVDMMDGVTSGIEASEIVEKPMREHAPSNWAVVGRYILPRDVMERLAHIDVGAGGEHQLTDGLAAYMASRGALYGMPFQGWRFDCGSKDGLLAAACHRQKHIGCGQHKT